MLYDTFVQMPKQELKRKAQKAALKSAKQRKVVEEAEEVESPVEEENAKDIGEEDDEYVEEEELEGSASQEDFFTAHYCQDLEEVEANGLLGADAVTTSELRLPSMGAAVHVRRTTRFSDMNPLTEWKSLQALGVRKKLRENIGEEDLSDDQNDFYQLLSRYMDVLVPTDGSREELREMYCLHALNHALRTRRLVIQHNARLRELKESGQLDDAAIDRYRDQGLVRPKVLILCPFRKTAMKVVDTITRLLFGNDSKKLVTNRKRFVKEFGGAGNDLSHRKDVDDDYKVGSFLLSLLQSSPISSTCRNCCLATWTTVSEWAWV